MLLWVIGVIGGIVFMIKPRPTWPVVANRKRAALVFVVSLVGFPLLSSVLGLTSSGGTTPSVQPKNLTPEQLAAERKAAEERQAAERQRQMKEEPENFLEVSNTRASKGGFDTVFVLSATIKNTSELDYKDPVIECDVFAETDTALGHVKQPVYKLIPAGKSVRITEENMGFANSNWEKYSCSVARATVAGSGH